jgi:hypothetical protein
MIAEMTFVNAPIRVGSSHWITNANMLSFVTTGARSRADGARNHQVAHTFRMITKMKEKSQDIDCVLSAPRPDPRTVPVVV